MRSDVSSDVQWPLFATHEVRWDAIPAGPRDEVVELLAHLFVEEVNFPKPDTEEEAKDVRQDKRGEC